MSDQTVYISAAMKTKLATKSREHLRYLVKVFWVDLQIGANRHPNTSTIAEHFEIGAKTPQQTLDFMRDHIKAPIAYSAEHRGWHYTEPHFALPAIELTEGDLAAILLAEKLSHQYRGTCLGQQVEQAFAKMLGAMTDKVSLDVGALADALSFEAATTTELDAHLFSHLGRAAIQRHRVETSYFTVTRRTAASHSRRDRNNAGEVRILKRSFQR